MVWQKTVALEMWEKLLVDNSFHDLGDHRDKRDRSKVVWQGGILLFWVRLHIGSFLGRRNYAGTVRQMENRAHYRLKLRSALFKHHRRDVVRSSPRSYWRVKVIGNSVRTSDMESDGTHRCDIFRPGITRGQKVCIYNSFQCGVRSKHVAKAVGFILSRESDGAVGSSKRVNAGWAEVGAKTCNNRPEGLTVTGILSERFGLFFKESLLGTVDCAFSLCADGIVSDK